MRRQDHRLARAGLVALGLLAMPCAQADPLAGERAVKLVDGQGTSVTIGTVRFTPGESSSTFALDLDVAPFEEHFLSMRPFKCLPHARYLLCHLPYPYETRHTVSGSDLADLEYGLLFIRKAASEYGINPYNGIYYRLHVDGDRLVGTLHETDLDVLAAPPDDGSLRPIVDDGLYEAELDVHAYPTLVIE